MTALDLIRESVRLVLQELIEAEATEVIGAARYERTETRATERNGSRPRLLSTQAGDVRAADPEAASGLVLPGHPGAAAADRPGAVCGGDGGLRARRLHPRRSMTWSRRWVSTPGSPSPRCRGSAPGWMRRSARSAPAPSGTPVPLRLSRRDLPACAQTGPARWCRWRSWWPPAITADGWPGDPRPRRRRQRG